MDYLRARSCAFFATKYTKSMMRRIGKEMRMMPNNLYVRKRKVSRKRMFDPWTWHYMLFIAYKTVLGWPLKLSCFQPTVCDYPQLDKATTKIIPLKGTVRYHIFHEQVVHKNEWCRTEYKNSAISHDLFKHFSCNDLLPYGHKKVCLKQYWQFQPFPITHVPQQHFHLSWKNWLGERQSKTRKAGKVHSN